MRSPPSSRVQVQRAERAAPVAVQLGVAAAQRGCVGHTAGQRGAAYCRALLACHCGGLWRRGRTRTARARHRREEGALAHHTAYEQRERREWWFSSVQRDQMRKVGRGGWSQRRCRAGREGGRARAQGCAEERAASAANAGAGKRTRRPPLPPTPRLPLYAHLGGLSAGRRRGPGDSCGRLQRISGATLHRFRLCLAASAPLLTPREHLEAPAPRSGRRKAR